MEDNKNRLVRLFILFSHCVKCFNIDEKAKFYLGDNISEKTMNHIIKTNKIGKNSWGALGDFIDGVDSSEIPNFKSGPYPYGHIKRGSYITNTFRYKPSPLEINLELYIKFFYKSSFFKRKYRELRLNKIINKNKNNNGR